MATLHILTSEDEILRKKSRPVTEITPRILTLLDDMAETLKKASGAGLAAPQVGVLRRIVLVDTPDTGLVEMINPEIVWKSEESAERLEGCLSVPNVWGMASRPVSATVRFQNRYGEWLELTGTGLSAQAFCHEVDHLDGIIYTDHARILTDEELAELDK